MVDQAYAKELIQKAKGMGAADAVAFDISQIVFDPRTLIKCMYGCEDWGKGHTCPSAHPEVSMEQYRDMFSRYYWGVIVHAHDKRTTQRISLALESKAFAEGRYFAFSLSDCSLCKDGCAEAGCRNKKMARPAFHSVGIDVFATAAKFNLPLVPLRDDGQQQNWYSAVFVE